MREHENVNRRVNRKAQRKTEENNEKTKFDEDNCKVLTSSFLLCFRIRKKSKFSRECIRLCSFLIIYEACKKLRYTNDCLSVNLSNEYQHESLP